LDLIAAGIKPGKQPDLALARHENLAVCLDAKRGKLYARSYRYHKKRWVPEGPARVLLIKEAAREFPRGSRIAGDGLTKFDAQHFERTPEKDWHPRASVLIELFEAKSPLLKKLTRPNDLLPVYLRNSEPEERLAEKRKHG
ncbi:MAG TPA: hypothetical protein PKV84_03200, partial [Candidatus Omnitrophota bacterium]|nr:hypothetical protein [Candidatus Omnitrophota bacterium]